MEEHEVTEEESEIESIKQSEITEVQETEPESESEIEQELPEVRNALV
jgi:hypothetical protein